MKISFVTLLGSHFYNIGANQTQRTLMYPMSLP
jgi:hypothetical protein